MTRPTRQAPGGIFISYRRQDSDFPASWIYERLASTFGREQIFKDVDSLEPGADFAEAILSAVRSCDAVLVLIGPDWLTTTGSGGIRRLDESDDFVRLEIEAALARNTTVIPILLGNTKMPRAEQLPDSLVGLARCQALELNPNRFGSDIDRLLRVLEKLLAEGHAPRNRPEHVSRIAAALRRIQDDEEGRMEIKFPPSPEYFLQFGFHTESDDEKFFLGLASDNQFISDPAYQLTEVQISRLLSMGWEASSGKESPGFTIFPDGNSDIDELAAFVFKTLTDGYGFPADQDMEIDVG